MKTSNYISAITGYMEGQMLYVVDVATGIMIAYDVVDMKHYVTIGTVNDSPGTWFRCVFLHRFDRSFFAVRIFDEGVIRADIDTKFLCKYGGAAYDETKGVISYKTFLVDNVIWTFPSDLSKEIRRFDVEKKRFADKIFIRVDEAEGMNCCGIVRYKNYFLCGIENTNIVVGVSLNGHETITYRLERVKKLESFFGEEDGIWIVDKEKEGFCEWNVDDGVIRDYNVQYMDYRNKMTFYKNFVRFDNYLIGMDKNAKGFIRVDLKNLEERNILFPDKYERTYNLNRTFFGTDYRAGNNLVLLPYSVDFFPVIDVGRCKMTKYSCEMTGEDYMTVRILENEIIYENLDLRLNDYLRTLDAIKYMTP